MRRLVGWAVAVALLGLVPAGAAAAADRPAGLSVSIADGVDQVNAGDRLSYTATVTNDGTSDVDGRLVITVPSYVRVTDAAAGDLSGADSSWKVAVPAGGHATKKLTGVVGRIPKGELRVTTLVSVYVVDDAQPVVRSADADSIVGVTDPAHAVKRDTPAADGPPLALIVGAVAEVLVLALLVGAFLWWRRRRSRTGSPGPTTS